MFYGVFFLLLGIILDVLKVAYHKKHTKIKKKKKHDMWERLVKIFDDKCEKSIHQRLLLECIFGFLSKTLIRVHTFLNSY